MPSADALMRGETRIAESFCYISPRPCLRHKCGGALELKRAMSASVLQQKTRDSMGHLRRRVAEFQEADANHDEVVSFEEWMASAP